MSEKRARTDKSDTIMYTCTDGGGEADISQSHSRHKKGHMTNTYLTSSDELNGKTNGHFTDMVQEAHAIQVWTGPKKMIEKQNWLYDKFYLLKSHIRCKELRHNSTQHPQSFNQHGQYGDQHAITYCITVPVQFQHVPPSTIRSWTSLHR